ncbi:MAG: TonB-dependent receptor [Sediminibacterium sp.]|nr:TonB-dependent receptor [Sediminibacterium sp.]
MNFKFFITLFFFTPIFLFAQNNNFTISGSVKDEKSGEVIIGCNIKIEGTKFNVNSNSYGFYSITLKAGEYNLLINSVGFQSKSIQVNLNQNKFIEILLNTANTELKSVEVSSVKKNIIDRPIMGLGKLDIKSLNKVPVVFGEKDILKTLQLLPGIKSTGEANSGISVRGGTEDQNFILLDEAPVYNPNHFGGLFSTFNSDALKDVQVYKGYAPAKYGGRLSSVFDIKMKEGNNQQFEGNGGIGLITSRFSIEGPIQKGKSSFIISARRSYADIFLLLSKDTNVSNNSFYFYA